MYVHASLLLYGKDTMKIGHIICPACPKSLDYINESRLFGHTVQYCRGGKMGHVTLKAQLLKKMHQYSISSKNKDRLSISCKCLYTYNIYMYYFFSRI